MNSPRLFLIGYRGTGKTTVGRMLADAVGWSFVDADDRIEAAAGKSIADIFAAEGEPGFRDRESAALAELCGGENRVVATGGGVILRPVNRELLKANGFVAWLTGPPELVYGRMQLDPCTAARRPNLTAAGGLDEVVRLMAMREALYRETASAAFDTAGRSPREVADAILAAWETSSCGCR